MVCLRADDPLEQAVIDQSGIEIVSVADVKGDCSQLRAEGDSGQGGDAASIAYVASSAGTSR